MDSHETASAVSGDVSPDVLYLVTRDGATIRFQHQRVQASRAHPLPFVLAVVIFSLLVATQAPWFLSVTAAFVAACAAIFVFDEERYRGRRRVKRELTLRFEGGSSYRARADVHVEVDGEALQAADARLVFRRWTDPLISNSRATIRTELCLVAARRVYLLATCSLNRVDIEPDDPSRLANAREWRARTVRGLAVGLLEATEERLPIDPTPLRDPDVYRPPFSLWPVAVLGQLLTTGCISLVGIHALAASRAPTTDWPTVAAYLGVFSLVALPAPLWWNMARTAARAPAVLRSVYGDVEPFPPGPRLRPWPAFLLAVALPVAFSLGWLRLFPQIYPW